ncbi:hypothetical protein DYQ86_09535 [Acidobacteria bacterium AB60]|nr:hypothetical protein DYQ86_09535 [Acidobacteria bacterium AB60]
MATVQSLIAEYAASLEALSGDDFQAEVCARLQAFITGFQSVPDKPMGDAGLDAIADHGLRAYCCYGPEHDAFKTPKKRIDGIIGKFSADLRRIYELDLIKGSLVFAESPEMSTILPAGRKIQQIELLVNWFESHRIIGPILTAVEAYQKASKCRYAECNAKIIVVGPKDLANRYAIDEVTITRARQRIFLQKVQEKSQTIVIGSTAKFDEKRDALKLIIPGKDAQIEQLWNALLSRWRMSLAFEQELADTLPNLHRDLEANRARILTRVLTLMVNSAEPWTQLDNATKIATEILEKDFDKLYGTLIDDVSSGEIARLIGECPIGWEKQVASV